MRFRPLFKKGKLYVFDPRRVWIIGGLCGRRKLVYRMTWYTVLGIIATLIILIPFDDQFRNAVGYGKITYDLPEYIARDNVRPINCRSLFRGNVSEIQRAKYKVLYDYDYLAISEVDYIHEGTKNCPRFLEDRGYVTSVSKEEEDFPIAFSILLYKDAAQAERLLRAVYRPNNYYCIHVDGTAEPGVRQAMHKLTQCFDNVKMASRTLDVVWGEFSVLETELVCIRDLLKYKQWRYFINLTGQEYPLKTNLQLVRILKAYNGANDIQATMSRHFENVRRWWLAGTPPHGIQPVLGSVHIVANRYFVDYAVNNQVSRDFLKWLERTFIPDETFFSTLNHNPQLMIPGSYQGKPESDPVTKPFLARYKLWDNGFLFLWDDCQGKYVHHICIFGIGDIQRFNRRKELFANKFHIDFEPIAYECMEQAYFTTVKQEQNGDADLDYSFYSSLGFVKNMVQL